MDIFANESLQELGGFSDECLAFSDKRLKKAGLVDK
jgi:hypothetical protein